MGAAAGAAVRPGELCDAHRPLYCLFAAIGQDGQLLRRGIVRPEGMIFPDIPVGPVLHLQHLLPGHGSVIVDDDGIRTHVKTHIVAGKGSAEHAADDVLAGMLLHVVKAAVPVDDAADRPAYRQGAVAGVKHPSLPLLNVQHRRAAQYAMVRRLTAALRIKGRAVQSHQTGAVLSLIALRDDGVKFPQECILII